MGDFEQESAETQKLAGYRLRADQAILISVWSFLTEAWVVRETEVVSAISPL